MYQLLFILSMAMPVIVVYMDLYILKKGKLRAFLDVIVLFVIYLYYMIKICKMSIMLSQGGIFLVTFIYLYINYYAWKKKEGITLGDCIVIFIKYFIKK